jgi:hypothetical protein
MASGRAERLGTKKALAGILAVAAQTNEDEPAKAVSRAIIGEESFMVVVHGFLGFAC